MLGTIGPLGVLAPIAGVGVRTAGVRVRELDDILSFLEVERYLKCNERLFVRVFY